MNIKAGCDIVKISRVKKLTESALKKIFHRSELKDYRHEHLAGIFAVKEAVFKALDLKVNSFLDVEIKYQTSGRPFLILSPELKNKISSIDCSVSHDGDYAIAVVVAILKKNSPPC